jgi:hypothetical protein
MEDKKWTGYFPTVYRYTESRRSLVHLSLTSPAAIVHDEVECRMSRDGMDFRTFENVVELVRPHAVS